MPTEKCALVELTRESEALLILMMMDSSVVAMLGNWNNFMDILMTSTCHPLNYFVDKN